jgi:nucleoside-diphosphate-sugar epimerase
MRLVSNPALAYEVIGWRSQIGLEEGLARTLAWVQSNANRYRTEDYVI